jgi:hypothetical protein
MGLEYLALETIINIRSLEEIRNVLYLVILSEPEKALL